MRIIAIGKLARYFPDFAPAAPPIRSRCIRFRGFTTARVIASAEDEIYNLLGESSKWITASRWPPAVNTAPK